MAVDTGAPLKRAVVALGGAGSRTTRTDAAGVYEFGRLPPGDYTVRCRKAGYLDAAYGTRGPLQPPVRFMVGADQVVGEINCSLQRLGAINGSIRDEDGDPVIDADVSALLKTYVHGHARYSLVGSARTDDHGTFRIYNLPPGRYVVHAWRGAIHDDTAYAARYYPYALSADGALVLNLWRGEEQDHTDLTLHETGTYRISGSILGSPQNAALTIGPEDFAGPNRVIPLNGTNFTIPNLVPARYRLSLSYSNNRGVGARTVFQTIELGESDINNVSFGLGAWPTLSAYLSADSRSPVPQGTRLSLSLDGTTIAPDVSRSANDSRSVFTNLRPGDYEVGCKDASGQNCALSYVALAGQDAVEGRIIIREGQPFLDLTATLDTHAASIGGQVTGEDGKPFSGAAIIAWSADADKRLFERYWHTTFSNERGAYVLRALPPGQYFVAIWMDFDPQQAFDPDVLRQLEYYAASVTAKHADTATQDLHLTPDVRAIAQNYVH